MKKDITEKIEDMKILNNKLCMKHNLTVCKIGKEKSNNISRAFSFCHHISMKLVFCKASLLVG